MKFQYILLVGSAVVAGTTAELPAQFAPAPARCSISGRQRGQALNQGEGRAVALKLAADLVSSFVYRDQGEAYAAALRKNAAAGRYDGGTRGALAKLLTDDLQAVHKAMGHVALAEGGARSGAGPPRRARRAISRR